MLYNICFTLNHKIVLKTKLNFNNHISLKSRLLKYKTFNKIDIDFVES